MRRLATALEKAFDRVIGATGVLATGFVLLIAFLVFGLSMSRTVFRTNVPGLFDGPVYALILLPFLTMAFTMRQGQQITIDTFTANIGARARTVLNVTTHLVSLVYVVVLIWQGTRWAALLFSQGSMTDGVFTVPKGMLVSAIVFGSALLFLQILRMAAHDLGSLRTQMPNAVLDRGGNVWIPSAVFIIGVGIGLALFVFVNPIAGAGWLTLVMLFSGMPVFLALGIVGSFGLYLLLGSSALVQVPITAYQSLQSFTLTCLPLYILGGVIMEQSGIAEDIFRFFELWLGRWRVSPLLVTTAAGMLFCAMSGSSVATTAVMAAVAYPMLAKRNFNKTLSCGLIVGATVGSLIPPSSGYVMYAVLVDESVAGLFMATLLPAVLLFVLYFVSIIAIGAFKHKWLYEGGQVPAEDSAQKVTWGDRAKALKTGVWGLLTPVILLGGIYSGLFTATEVAAVLVVYSALVAVLVKGLTWRSVIAITSRSAVVSSMLLCIIFSAFVFAVVVSQLRIAAALSTFVRSTGMGAPGVTLLVFAVLMILGLPLEGASLKVLTLPVLYPVAMSVGIDSLWLGVFYQFMGEIAAITPPVGLELFVMQRITGLPMIRVAKGCVPFLLLMLLVTFIMYVFPQLATWLPGTLRK